MDESSALAAQMARDACLPDSIRPASAQRTGQAKIALLTGAGGFLGRYAVRSLLRDTDVRIICLMRGFDFEQTRERLIRGLVEVGISEHVVAQRIEMVLGDVSLPRLGLSLSDFNRLAVAVDLLYHCAAQVNWARGYNRLRRTNTLPVVELLRLCCTGPATPIVFVSTLAVCFSPTQVDLVDEMTDMSAHAPNMPLGYAQSKCIAESLLRRARRAWSIREHSPSSLNLR